MAARQRTHQEYVEQVKAKTKGRVTVVGQYQKALLKVTHGCSSCGHRWEALPSNILQGKCGCPRCNNRMMRTQDMYVADLATANSTLTLAGSFAGMKTPVLHTCRGCGNSRDIRPHDALACVGCPFCHPKWLKGVRRREINFHGRQLVVQGFEEQALHWIVRHTKVQPDDILVGKQVPRFSYRYNGRKRWYYPDMFIEARRIIVEVKSLWTAGLSGKGVINHRRVWSELKAKAKAVAAQGFTFKLVVMKPSGERISLPTDWLTMTKTQIQTHLECF